MGCTYSKTASEDSKKNRESAGSEERQPLLRQGHPLAPPPKTPKQILIDYIYTIVRNFNYGRGLSDKNLVPPTLELIRACLENPILYAISLPEIAANYRENRQGFDEVTAQNEIHLSHTVLTILCTEKSTLLSKLAELYIDPTRQKHSLSLSLSSLRGLLSESEIAEDRRTALEAQIITLEKNIIELDSENTGQHPVIMHFAEKLQNHSSKLSEELHSMIEQVKQRSEPIAIVSNMRRG